MSGKDIDVVQVGANIGKSQTDATWILIDKFGWTGLFVEPIPQSFEKLKKYYSSKSEHHTFENCAIIGDKDVDKVNMKYSSNPALSVIASVGNCTYRYENDLDLEVPAMSLEKLLEKHGLLNKEFELLQMDVEGLEADIVKKTDFNKVIPKRIRLETIRSYGMGIEEYLQSFGYKVVNDYCWDIYEDHLIKNKEELQWEIEEKRFNTLLERQGI